MKETKQHQLTHINSVPTLKVCLTFECCPIVCIYLLAHRGK